MGRNLIPVSGGTADRMQVFPKVYSFREEWDSFAAGGRWSTYLTGSSTIGVGAPGVDQSTGCLSLSSIDSAPRELYVYTSLPLFEVGQKFPLSVEASANFSDISPASLTAVVFGLMSSVGAGSLQSSGDVAGNFFGAVINKAAGGTQWKTCSSNGSTQVKNQSSSPAGGTLLSPDAAFHRLTITIEPVSSTIAEVSYSVDGSRLTLPSARPGLGKLKDQLSLAGALPMYLILGLRTGDSFPQQLSSQYIDARSLAAA